MKPATQKATGLDDLKASLHRLLEQNVVLRAQVHARTGKLPIAPMLSEVNSPYLEDLLSGERILTTANESLRAQLAAAPLRSQAPATGITSPNLATPPAPSAYAPQPDFSKMSMDELCLAVRAGKISQLAASKILDARFTQPQPLTAQCRAGSRK